MKRVAFRLDEAFYQRFKEWCKKNGITMSEALSRAVQFIIRDEGLEEEIKKEKLKRILGMEEDVLEMIRKETLAELRDIFTSNEAMFLSLLLYGCPLVKDVFPKYFILETIEEKAKNYIEQEKFGVKLVTLKQKVLNLTSFQALVLVQEIAKFSGEDKDKPLSELVKRISRGTDAIARS